MLKFIVLVIIGIVPYAQVFAQTSSDNVQKQLFELRQLCNSMQEENLELKNQIRTKDSLAYVGVRTEIFEAFNHVSKINFDFLNTSGKIAVTGLFTKLLQANNPTSDILGFKFNETILAAAEKCFLAELKTESEKLRFGQVISKLVNNPVISTIANTNPITSVTAAIISTVAGFSTTTLSVEKNGNKIRNVSANTSDAFNQKNIESFKSELQPYINFYDALNLASDKYLNSLEQVKQRYNFLKGNVETYKSQLSGSIKVNDTNTLVKLASLLPDPNTKNIEFHKYLRDPRVIQCAAVASRLPDLEQSVSDFQKEYNQTLYIFLKEYISALSSASKLPATSMDQSKITSLIADIQSFIAKEIQAQSLNNSQ